MPIKSVEFIKSSAKLDQCPENNLPEYAMVGRSNVGKSSLINMLTNKRKIALTSGTPGKTRLINHFLVNNEWYLVDLPGYGYAKLSKKEKEKFEGIIKGYLTKRTNLSCLFLLIDIRHEPLEADLDFLNWLGENMIPFVIVFTKSDKISNHLIEGTVEKYTNILLESWETLPKIFISSSAKHLGKDDIIGFIENTNKLLKSN